MTSFPQRITQRQANLGLITAQAVLCVFVGLLALALDLGPAMVGGSAVGLVMYGGLLFAYRRGYEWARYATVAATTLLTGAVIVLDHQRLGGFTPAFFAPPVLALILSGPLTIGLSGLTLLLIVAFGIPAPNPYVETVRLVIIAVVVGGMMLARAVLDSEGQERADAARAALEAQAAAEREQATAQRQAAELEQRAEVQQRLLDLVGELETPAVQISEGVLLAPIIGALDSSRLAKLGDKILRDIMDRRAQLLVLDLAGVTLVDTEVAQGISRIVASIRLLGCAVTVTGISATVAMTLSQLEVGFGEVKTARSPQEALSSHLNVLAQNRRN